MFAVQDAIGKGRARGVITTELMSEKEGDEQRNKYVEREKDTIGAGLLQCVRHSCPHTVRLLKSPREKYFSIKQ